MSEFSLIEKTALMVAISGTGANVVLRAAVDGKRIVVYQIVIETDTDTAITFRSDTDAISGAMSIAAAGPALELKNAGAIVLACKNTNKSLNVNQTTAGAQIEGYALIGLVDGEPIQ